MTEFEIKVLALRLSAQLPKRSRDARRVIHAIAYVSEIFLHGSSSSEGPAAGAPAANVIPMPERSDLKRP
jgi:hypothetical protein